MMLPATLVNFNRKRAEAGRVCLAEENRWRPKGIRANSVRSLFGFEALGLRAGVTRQLLVQEGKCGRTSGGSMDRRLLRSQLSPEQMAPVSIQESL